MRVTILGKRYDLVFRHQMRKHLGLCDSPQGRDKKIKIDSKLSGQEKLNVLIHEVFHAGNWHCDESHTEAFATDLARILWKLGYRGPRDCD